MGATTFYLLELEKKRKQELERQKQKTEEENVKQEVDYNKLTKDEIKAILDEKGIDYDPKAKKDELVKLLEGAE